MTTGTTTEVIATIVVVTIIAVAMLLFYFVCRSDDPIRDHTCVALLYPSSRKDLRQLRIPLDPAEPTDIHVNEGYERDQSEVATSRSKDAHHSVLVHSPKEDDKVGSTQETSNGAASSHCQVTLQVPNDENLHNALDEPPQADEIGPETVSPPELENQNLGTRHGECFIEQAKD